MTEVADDSAPLLSKDGSPMSEDEDLSNIIFFHGKELRGALGKSFIRKPGTQQVLVRIGVGKDGVFKVDGEENKVLVHWKFSELKDWSFSGYSFTLQFRVGPNYSVRTDDGEAICMYIEEFQKHPEEALKKARDNPPNSKIPESGIRTLRKKFSAADANPPTPSEQVRFYTLNRRTSKKSADPTSKLAHNIEVDSRLRSAYAQESSSNSSSDMELGFREPTFLQDKRKVNGIPEPLLLETENKQHAHNHTNRNDDIPQPEKPVSTGVCSSPTSTKGESTRNQVTQHVPSSGKATPPKPSSPLLQRHIAPDQLLLPPGKRESGKREDVLSPEDLEEYYYLRPRSVSETAATRPINVVKAYTAPRSSASSKKESKGGEGQSRLRSVTLGSAGHSVSSAHAQGNAKQKQKPPQLQQLATPTVNRGASPSDSECSGDLTPLAVRASSSMSTSSGTFSPDDFQAMSPQQYQARVKELQREEPKWYENSPSPDEMGKPRPVSPPYDTLSRSDSEVSSKLEFAGGIRSRHSNASDAESLRMSLTSPTGSPTYDHLSNLRVGEAERSAPPSSKPPGSEKMDFLSAAMDVSIRRNVSQPVFGSGGGGGDGRGVRISRSSPSPGPDSILEETESDEELAFSSSFASEGTSDTSGVVLRQKKERPQPESDPFEDLLGTPQAVTRLRWSQELNPLYDYIKGMRITESITSQNTGIKLYSATTILSPESTKNNTPKGNGSIKLKKPPSVILEESESETGSPQHGDTVPLITHSLPTEEGPEKQPMVYLPPGSSNLSRPPRRTHLYEEVELTSQLPQVKSEADLIKPPPILKKMEGGEGMGARATTLAALSNPVVRRLQTLDAPQERSGSISPRLGKRQLQQRRSRTIGCVDDTEAITRKQRPVRAADTMKDFSFVMREYRLFYIKMPNGRLHSEVFSINKPVSELREKLCDLLGVDIPDNYLLYVEGACLTSLRDEVGEAASHRGIGRSGSLTHINDQQWLPDQGSEPILLKPNLSFRMQGITTSRVLAMMSDDVVAESNITYPSHILMDDETEEFHKSWISVVQGNVPCTQEHAVKLAAIQYQAYFLDRTALHSVVGFCRPTEFLPIECSSVRGVEQKMYKEQERLKLKTHKEVHEAYIRYMSRLPTFDAVFFPVREPRKKMLQSTKLKPVILGVGSHGIMRVDPKTKEVLDMWEYQVLRNWAYSRKTFVLAFTDKNYPVESNQAKWISMLVDFHVDSIINTAGGPIAAITNTAPSQPANS